MSDEFAPVVAEPSAPTTSQPVPANAVTEPTTNGENEEPPVSKTFTQEDVDKIVSKRLSKAERAWERRHQQLLETTLARVTAPAQPVAQQPAAGDEAPDPNKFESYTDYLRELTRYEADQAVKRTGMASKEAQQRMTAQQQAEQIQRNLQSRLSSAAEKYDDFEDVVMSSDLPITQYMAEVIAESDIGGEVAYYLGKNKAEAARIAAMSPLAAARALGLIEAKLVNVPPNVSNAPPPPTPVGNRSVVSKDPDKMSVEEWTKWRESQIKSRNR